MGIIYLFATGNLSEPKDLSCFTDLLSKIRNSPDFREAESNCLFLLLITIKTLL